MMTAKELAKVAQEQRAAEQRKAVAAFQRLKVNADFEVAWQYLQRLFPLYAPSFMAGDEANSHRAAIRDGEKNVMRKILQLLSLPTAEAEEPRAVATQAAAGTRRRKAAASELSPAEA